jgi:hypothetical protein
MKIKMEVRGLWVAVDPDSVEFQVDRMALDAICSVVSSEMITTLTTSDSTQEAWESIMVMCIDNDRIRKASAQKLRREYEVPKFRDKEGVEDFTMWLSGIVNQLAVLGDPEPDDKVVLKFLRIARPRYKQLVISIEMLLDVSTLSPEEITNQLRSTEEDGVTPCVAEGKLYFTEEWVERSKKDADSGRGGSSSSGSQGRGGDDRSWGWGHGGRGYGAGSSGERRNCHRCGKLGH